MRVVAVVLGALLVACSSDGSDGGGSPDAGLARGPKFYEEVAPILAAHCLRCHSPGGIAPFSLVTYDDALAEAEGMMLMTSTREMPPYLVNSDGSCGEFQEVTRLTDDEIDLIADWVNGEKREGDPAKAPPQPEALPGLDEVTKTLEMAATYTPNDRLEDDYRCFVLDAPLESADAFLTGFEFVPGDKRVVHHAILFAMSTVQAENKAIQLDMNDPEVPGYTCFGGSRTGSDLVLAGWAPGQRATEYPTGTGIRVRAGRKLVLQVHYNLLAGAHPDRSGMKLRFAPSVTKEAFNLPLANAGLTLAPKQSYVTDSYELVSPLNALAWAVYPHMHTLGQTLKVELTRDGQTTCIVDIPRWSFHWQRFYTYKTPIEVHAGDKVMITCGYDTSKRDTVVTWGEGTEDEMCLAGFYLTAK